MLIDVLSCWVLADFVTQRLITNVECQESSYIKRLCGDNCARSFLFSSRLVSCFPSLGSRNGCVTQAFQGLQDLNTCLTGSEMDVWPRSISGDSVLSFSSKCHDQKVFRCWGFCAYRNGSSELLVASQEREACLRRKLAVGCRTELTQEGECLVLRRWQLSVAIGHTHAPADPDVSVRWANKPLCPLALSSLSHADLSLFNFRFLIYKRGLISPTLVYLLWEVSEGRHIKTFFCPR